MTISVSNWWEKCNQFALEGSLNMYAVPVLGLRSCRLFSTKRAAVVSSPTAPSTNRMQFQGFLAVMRLNLTRPMEKPVDIKGITSAPCIAPEITFVTALLNLLPFHFLSI